MNKIRITYQQESATHIEFFFLFKIYKRLKGVPEIETRLLKCFGWSIQTGSFREITRPGADKLSYTRGHFDLHNKSICM